MQVTSYTRKSRRFSTYKGVVGRIAPNRVNRRFKTSVPHQKITTDTTEFKYYEPDDKGRVSIKKLYLDPFMDMWNLEILSYGISDRPSAQSIMKQEMYYGHIYSGFDELKEAIDKYICYYNQKRSKASLGYRSPVEYREYMLAA